MKRTITITLFLIIGSAYSLSTESLFKIAEKKLPVLLSEKNEVVMDILFFLNGFINTSGILEHFPNTFTCGLKEGPIISDIQKLKQQIREAKTIDEKLNLTRQYFERLEPEKKKIDKFCWENAVPEIKREIENVKKYWKQPGIVQRVILNAIERYQDIIKLVEEIINCIDHQNYMEAGCKLGEIYLILIFNN